MISLDMHAVTFKTFNPGHKHSYLNYSLNWQVIKLPLITTNHYLKTR